MSTPTIKDQINQVLADNVLSDLKRFIDKRQCLKESNMVLVYLFHIVQSAGILTTTIATGYNNRQYIWLGVALNVLASLINAIEQTNNNISKKLMTDIQLIKDGKYVDDGIVDVPANQQSKNQNQPNGPGNTLEKPLLDA
jgi:hypothetical protein